MKKSGNRDATPRSRPTRVEIGKLVVDGRVIGDALQSRRKALGLSLDAVSKKAQIGVATIHAIEHGNLSMCLDKFLTLLGALDLTPLDVLGDYVVDRSTDQEFGAELARRAKSSLPGLLSTILRLVGEPQQACIPTGKSETQKERR